MTTMTQEKDQATYTVVSRHHTSQGEVTYVRCNSCGALRMLHLSGSHGGAMTAGHHANRCPTCE